MDLFGSGFELNNLINIRFGGVLDIVKAVAEILILTYFIFAVLNLVRQTRAWQLLKGVILLVAVMAFSNWLRLNTLSFILNNTFSVLAIGAFIIFQPELRRGLEQIGRSTALDIFAQTAGQARALDDMIDQIVRACSELSRTSTGALIVVERQTKVGDIINTGIKLDADVSAELLMNIFSKNTPLHDGAVVISGLRVEAATCYLPLTDDAGVDKELGLRHRSAIGMTEVSDAVVVVVSEETGYISLIVNREIERGLTDEELRARLTQSLAAADTPSRGINFLKGKGKTANERRGKRSKVR